MGEFYIIPLFITSFVIVSSVNNSITHVLILMLQIYRVTKINVLVKTEVVAFMYSINI